MSVCFFDSRNVQVRATKSEASSHYLRLRGFGVDSGAYSLLAAKHTRAHTILSIECRQAHMCAGIASPFPPPLARAGRSADNKVSRRDAKSGAYPISLGLAGISTRR